MLNQRLGKVEKEMREQSAGSAPQVYGQDGEHKGHSVESNRLISEDNSHYILIKGDYSCDDYKFKNDVTFDVQEKKSSVYYCYLLNFSGLI